MHLRTTMEVDVPLIRRWMEADPEHSLEKRNSPEFLLTGNGLLAFCLADDKGPLAFMRLDADGEMVRASIQFGPPDEVSKRRMTVGLMRLGFPAIVKFAQNNKYVGIVFESVNASLIGFLESRYKICKATGDDYTLVF
jgi:hypothetical protein